MKSPILSTECRANAKRRRECSVTKLRKTQDLENMVLFVEKPVYDRILNVVGRKTPILRKTLYRNNNDEKQQKPHARHASKPTLYTPISKESGNSCWHNDIVE
ncbi:MAG: hypothetical protein GY820_45010 [Gammaproteobacteria bacterium]|nr:hypothetical protein [Gammaproteobacteria bacterium]